MYKLVYTSKTHRIMFQDITLQGVFQGFPLCEVLRVQHYSESILLEYVAAFPGSTISIYSEYPRYLAFSNTAHILLVYPQCFSRYSQHETYSILRPYLEHCCDAGCCWFYWSCWSCCCCCCRPSGASSVGMSTLPAASDETCMQARYAMVGHLRSTFYHNQHYHCCTLATVNTSVGR